MFIARTIALAAILAFTMAGPAPAAARHQKAADSHTGDRAGVTPQRLNSESPELAGGGSLGHNEMKGW